MADILSDKLGMPVKKPCTEEQGAAPFHNIDTNAYDFDDWLPIPNNKQDFDLQKIIAEVEQLEAQDNNQAPTNALPSSNPVVDGNQNANPVQDLAIAAPPANPTPGTSGHNVIQNYTQAQNFQ